jgi:hypothetical protein
MDERLASYRQHSAVTHPGEFLSQVRELPRDVGQLIDIVGGIFAHFEHDFGADEFRLPPERRPEVDFRFARSMFERILELDPSPLINPRALPNRVMGTCRDASMLLCSMLRSQDIPARLRYGFAPYPPKAGMPLTDHVLVEYWSAADQRWKWADGRLYRHAIERNDIRDLDRTDLPASYFVPAARAWSAAQHDQRFASRLSGLRFNPIYGLWRARNLFMYDLAALAKSEPLLWDAWGYMLRTPAQTRPRGFFQFWRLNQLAGLDARQPRDCQRLLRAYRANRNLRVPDRVKVCSHVNGDHVAILGRSTPRAYAVN